ncbi:MAG: DUF4249 domain-containing protein [Duncaniella sp.]|nr:DUF4249 domain-containing protein [Duncaniella sp.]
MTMSILRYLCPILILVLSASCKKELDFKYLDIEPLTVIEGELTPEGIRVGITLTTPMGEPMDRTPLTDASVTLSDLTDGTTITLIPDAEGYYTGSRPGVAGHEYRLTVERDGSTYEAVTTMYPSTEIISLEFNWIKMPYDQVAILQGKFLDTDVEGQCYWVQLLRNGESYQWIEVDNRGAIDGVYSFLTMTSRRDTDEEEEDEVLFDGDVMTCRVCPVSRGMYDYLGALQIGSNGPAMFSGDRCLGYFMATSPVSQSIVFHPDEISDYN